ncbi:hypothetical protein HG535_0B04350 [Zygotorulaspora mrakii]|uniref:SGF29 C-terminal domain-containing protein n=1 Tax=Zygotorulaspora mrakii TaxID=42260 RepID=A0A7H9AYW3_ZYGMR|nr:uncharacterized protein HG535_0B04350 [Zygotorulaspora mrakii]QLG71393.1 hypothetical protein HG535_0B04350 [Zygotorulaspora mrakii]
MDGQWDIVISSLQDIYNANEVLAFDDDVNSKRINFANLPEEQVQSHLTHFEEHLENVKRAQRLLDAVRSNLQAVIEHVSNKELAEIQVLEEADSSRSDNGEGDYGKCYWVSQYNPSGPIRVGSEVAYKPRKGGEGEWFQCEVVRVSPDGMKFEVRDPEPDELGNTGKLFKCNWKDLIFIPPAHLTKPQVPNYPPGTKVLARYPETTTFYPAMVIGTKRDGICKLRFDGEEEVDKETEVTRRLVLPYPSISSTPAKR